MNLLSTFLKDLKKTYLSYFKENIKDIKKTWNGINPILLYLWKLKTVVFFHLFLTMRNLS